MIAGFNSIEGGDFYFNDKRINDIDPSKRNIGMVFQNYALYPHLTVEKNIQFPLENLKGADKLSKEEMSKRVLEAAKLVQIDHLLERKPNELSGGQQQRVAAARAMVTNPAIVLADEPTGALDSKATDSLLNLFGQINREGQTILMVTHSTKAASHAGRVLFIKDGEVFHQLYRGNMTNEQLYARIADTLTVLQAGGEQHE